MTGTDIVGIALKVIRLVKEGRDNDVAPLLINLYQNGYAKGYKDGDFNRIMHRIDDK